MIRYKPRGQYSGVMDEHKDGPFVLHIEAQTEIDALHAECDRLTSVLQYEEGRRTRIGTHGTDCWKWGPSHYECALREIDRLTAMLVESKMPEQPEPSKPHWANAPEWAQWLAMDDDGAWWWYEDLPVKYETCWDRRRGKRMDTGRTGSTWADTLEQRP